MRQRIEAARKTRLDNARFGGAYTNSWDGYSYEGMDKFLEHDQENREEEDKELRKILKAVQEKLKEEIEKQPYSGHGTLSNKVQTIIRRLGQKIVRQQQKIPRP